MNQKTIIYEYVKKLNAEELVPYIKNNFNKKRSGGSGML